MKHKEKEIKVIFVVVTLIFAFFLAVPVLQLLGKSFLQDGGVTGDFYQEVFASKGFLTAVGNSFQVSSLGALITTGIAFLLA